MPPLIGAGILLSWDPRVSVDMGEGMGSEVPCGACFPVSCGLGKGRCCSRRHYVLPRNFDPIQRETQDWEAVVSQGGKDERRESP